MFHPSQEIRIDESTSLKEVAKVDSRLRQNTCQALRFPSLIVRNTDSDHRSAFVSVLVASRLRSDLMRSLPSMRPS